MQKMADHMVQRITDMNERLQPANLRFKPPPAQHYSKSRTIESSDEDEGPPLLVNGKHANGAGGSGSSKPINGFVSSIKATVNGGLSSPHGEIHLFQLRVAHIAEAPKQPRKTIRSLMWSVFRVCAVVNTTDVSIVTAWETQSRRDPVLRSASDDPHSCRHGFVSRRRHRASAIPGN